MHHRAPAHYIVHHTATSPNCALQCSMDGPPYHRAISPTTDMPPPSIEDENKGVPQLLKVDIFSCCHLPPSAPSQMPPTPRRGLLLSAKKTPTQDLIKSLYNPESFNLVLVAPDSLNTCCFVNNGKVDNYQHETGRLGPCNVRL